MGEQISVYKTTRVKKRHCTYTQTHNTDNIIKRIKRKIMNYYSLSVRVCWRVQVSLIVTWLPSFLPFSVSHAYKRLWSADKEKEKMRVRESESSYSGS